MEQNTLTQDTLKHRKKENNNNTENLQIFISKILVRYLLGKKHILHFSGQKNLVPLTSRNLTIDCANMFANDLQDFSKSFSIVRFR